MQKIPLKSLFLTSLLSLFIIHSPTAANPKNTDSVAGKSSNTDISSHVSSDSKTAAAIMAAEEFLLLIDTSQYAQSWDIASSFFKSQVTKETWVKQISSLRPAFGKVTNRQIQNADYLTELPGAPDGQYIVIQYDSSFENKRKAVETITPMLDEDGKWRVSGYYIQ